MSKQSPTRPIVAIHGGAGTLTRAAATVEQQAQYRDALASVLREAQALLQRGAPALDVVIEAVRLLEE
ncbi:MAG TPA: isoaspartyl peptidase/L-asparaginase, partial [Burkholderiaceae bacterium]|nr:isoaspartyl peptidase/L-asparaginase [Burkholderiaceae bacterium]